MALRMACPTKRKGSDNWYYRRTIPADVRALLAKLPARQRPRGWYKTHISISLGTADRDAAKAKCPRVADEVERQLKALRSGPKPLTPKQIAALSGKLYKTFTEGLEDNPILSPEQWRTIAQWDHDARTTPLKIGLGIDDEDDKGNIRAGLSLRFGRLADFLLRTHHLVTDADSRWKLIERLSLDMPHAAEKLARNADADFTPDTYGQRFPAFEAASEATTPSDNSHTSLSGLAEAWHEAAIARHVTKRDAKRFRRVLERFSAWLGHDDAGRVTHRDVVRWADTRNKEGISTATINKVDMPSLRVIFKWGKSRGWLKSNPALDEDGSLVRIEGRRAAKVRDKFYSQDEAAAILSAALSVEPRPKERPTTTEAKRWVPWLCAYSGARVMEMLQLRKQDVRKEQGAWIIRLTPEAGGIKTNEFRDVPVHEHLVAAGFIRFVESSANGPLFIAAGKDGSAKGVYDRLRVFIRSIVSDPNVQPNHGWRYTFKTIGLESGISEHILDAISGHAPKTIGGVYTKVTLRARIDAMRKFPRYDAENTGRVAAE